MSDIRVERPRRHIIGGIVGDLLRHLRKHEPVKREHAVARDLGGVTPEGLGDAIAVIGDGSMSAGMAFEAMNNEIEKALKHGQ